MMIETANICNTKQFWETQAESTDSRMSNNTSKHSHFVTFPTKLRIILSDQDLSHIITWLPHGYAWKILDLKYFVENVMPKYFETQTKYSSFTRQVNGWGFSRVTHGVDRGAYYHPLFLRDHPELAKGMKRRVSEGQSTSSIDRSRVGSNMNDTGSLSMPSHAHAPPPPWFPLHRHLPGEPYPPNHMIPAATSFPYSAVTDPIYSSEYNIDPFTMNPWYQNQSNFQHLNLYPRQREPEQFTAGHGNFHSHASSRRDHHEGALGSGSLSDPALTYLSQRPYLQNPSSAYYSAGAASIPMDTRSSVGFPEPIPGKGSTSQDPAKIRSRSHSNLIHDPDHEPSKVARRSSHGGVEASPTSLSGPSLDMTRLEATASIPGSDQLKLASHSNLPPSNEYSAMKNPPSSSLAMEEMEGRSHRSNNMLIRNPPTSGGYYYRDTRGRGYDDSLSRRYDDEFSRNKFPW